MAQADRLALLERHGRAYGELRLAIGWTDGLEGEPAKRSRHWQSSPTLLADAEHGAGIFRRGLTRNPVLSLAASKLIGVDVDGEAGRELCRRLVPHGLPATVSVRSGRVDGGVHLWYRPPGPGHPAKVEFSAESGLTLSKDGYLVIPPALHETGAAYSFAEGRAPWEHAIVEFPAAILQALADDRRVQDELERADDTSPIGAGGRHRHLRRIGGAMRRAGAREESIAAALLVENEFRGDPPKDEHLVRELARDIAHRYPPGARA
jgi:hypothetical protein